jgi:hypothetical protein
MVSKLPSLVVSAVTTFDGKALAKGGNQIAGFAKKAASALGLAFSTQAVIKFGKDSVKAFAENEKSAKRLAGVVKNLGQAFETPFIEKNIDQISAKYGYQGEVIREAFQKVLTATGSVTKSNELLNASLDIAAGSGQDLVSVNQDLAALYQGNTKGLKKYNLGLSQAELKTLDFEDGLALLTKTFKGAAGDELQTYSGKMRVLGEAADNAQEIIGKSLVDSFALLSGEGNSIEPLAESMADLATYTGDVITGIATLIAKFKELPGMDFYLKNIFPELLKLNTIGQGIDLLSKLGADKAAPGTGRDSEHKGRIGYVDPNQAKRDKIEQDRLKRERERRALEAKALKDEKAKLSLSKAAAVFDSTRISLSAALKATYDKETKLRLEALMLIEQDKGDEALKKIGELAAFQKNADMQRLAGVETISNATLESLNKQLLTELKVINDSKMAEGNKELAREEAFKKYNAAITAAGTLAAKESYNERVQIQLTEIARLASISKTNSAATTANLLLESAELSMIDRVAKAQAEADAKRLKALNDYALALSKVGTGLEYGGNKLGTPVPDFVPPDWVKDISNMGRTASDGSLSFFDPARVGMTSGGTGGPQNIELTINTGIGDPEAIARAVEDLLNQSTYRGTSTNRGVGNYFE